MEMGRYSVYCGISLVDFIALNFYHIGTSFKSCKTVVKSSSNL